MIETLLVRGFKYENEFEMIQLADRGYVSPIFMLGWMSRTDQSIMVLRQLTERSGGLFDDSNAVAALNSLARLGDCAWIDLAKRRLPKLKKLQLFVAGMLASAGEWEGWEYVRDTLTKGKSAREKDVAYAFEILRHFDAVNDPIRKLPVLQQLNPESIPSEEIRREFVKVRDSVGKGKR